jgi:hypothetical protein
MPKLQETDFCLSAEPPENTQPLFSAKKEPLVETPLKTSMSPEHAAATSQFQSEQTAEQS